MIHRTEGLGAYIPPGANQMLSNGVTSVNSEDCYAGTCGYSGLTPEQRYLCSANGIVGARFGCLDPFCLPWRNQLGCPAPAAAPAAPTYTAPAPSPVAQPSTYTAPAPAPAVVAPANGYKPASYPTVTVQTSSGPVEVSAEVVPGVYDQANKPANVRISNIWDQLDPDKLSQFTYRGLARSLPSWVSEQYRRGGSSFDQAGPVMTDQAAAGAGNFGGSSSLLWIVAAAAAAWLLLGEKRRRAPARPRVRKV